MIAYEEALQCLLEQARDHGMTAVEQLPTQQAAGRVSAAAVHSSQCLPPFDNSAMDGFALCLQGHVTAPGTEWAVTGWQAAGDAAAEGASGAWEIMTGARLPAGLDSVVPVEQVEVLVRDGARPLRIRLRAAVQPGQFVRLRGQDVATGEEVLGTAARLDTNAITLLHALGVGSVPVRARPRVAVIATGKELVGTAAQALESGQIRDSNRPYLVSRLQAAGADVVLQDTVSDEVAAFDAALDAALAAGARVVVSTGAVSAGRYDFIPDALRARGARVCFHKVAIRPGKPILFARLEDGALYFGLPGNPVSTAVGQRFFVEPVLRVLLGLPPETPLTVPLAHAVEPPAGMRWHARAQVRLDARGQLSAHIGSGQESFRLATTLHANAWAVMEPREGPAPAGTHVQVLGWGHHEPIHFDCQET
ncbi:molybdopterin molybdotransferase MoeA [Xanthomonas sp. 60]